MPFGAFNLSYITMEITQFKERAEQLVRLKAQIAELENEYSEMKQEIMDAYDALWVKTYEIEWTWIKITKKSRTTYNLIEWLKADKVMEDYPDYVVIKKSLDTKKLQTEKPELFAPKVTEFVSVTWM